MEINLQKQHNLVEKEVIEYRFFLSRGIWSCFLPHKLIKITCTQIKLFIKSQPSDSDKSMEALWADQLMNIAYSKKDIKNPFYEIARGPDTLHRLCCHIENKYPDVSFSKLIKVQELSNINRPVHSEEIKISR